MRKEDQIFHKNTKKAYVPVYCKSYGTLVKTLIIFTSLFFNTTNLSFGLDQLDAAEFSKLKTPKDQINVMKHFESTPEVLDSYLPVLTKKGNKKALFFWFYAKFG